MLFFICSDFGMTGADVRVGNYRYLLNQQTLCNAVLQETVDSMAQTGYTDLTKWAFQKEQTYPNKCVFDDGASAPYICGGTIGMLNPFISEVQSDEYYDVEEGEE